MDLTDEDGTHPAAGRKDVTVTAVPPTIGGVTNTGPADEGGPVTVSVAATDAVDPTGVLTYAFDFDGDGVYEVGPQAGSSAAHAFPDNGTYTVGVRVTDADGVSADATTTVVVRNVDVAYLVGSDLILQPDAAGSFRRTVSFIDPGADEWTGTVDYGDGGAGPLSVDAAAKQFTLAHTYTKEGTYTVSSSCGTTTATRLRTRSRSPFT